MINQDYIITDVPGKIRNLKIHPSNGIRALYEAFVNSIQAIEEKHEKSKLENPEIKITLIRDENILFEFNDISDYAVSDVIIYDNGIGFNDINYNSFKTSESVYKQKRGGKGVGRFFWLKVFEYVKIESCYYNTDKNKFYYKEFEFRKSRQGIHLLKNESKEKKQITYTKISLFGLREKYQKHFSRNYEQIADLIIQNHISYFIQESCPSVKIINQTKEKSFTLKLNKKFNSDYILKIDNDSFEIKNEKFKIEFLKIKSLKNKPKHTIFYSAHKRSVAEQNIAGFIKDLKDVNIEDNDFNEKLYISVIVTGNYLDEYVDDVRTNFSFPEGDEEETGSSVVTMRQIKNKTKTLLKKYLENYLIEIKKDKISYIKKLVNKKFYGYRSLLKHTDYLDDIDITSGDEKKIEISLHKAKNKLITDIKEKTNEIIDFDSVADPDKQEEYKKKFKEIIREVNDVGQLSLVDYVIHRKIILKLFEKALGTESNDNYEKESVLHNLIVPMKITSEDIEFEQNNLWLVDEKLVYHDYLASDKPLNNEYFKKGSNRPDVIIANDLLSDNPLVYVEKDKDIHDTIVILEFKKPMTKNIYKDDPTEQLLKYVIQIEDENAYKATKEGRLLKTSSNCIYYCYLICDFPKNMAKNLIKFKNFHSTPDKELLYKFPTGSSVKIFYQIITYDKILKDANARNNFFFEKLGLNID